jgi:predicted O-methyltransferase YrrM
MRVLNHNWDSVLERFRRGVIVCHLRALQFLYKKRPVLLSYWLSFRSALQAISHSPNLLSPAADFFTSSGASLPVHELKELLRNELLGPWTLDGDTISFLWEEIQQDQPKVVMECGAGVSTLVLAQSLVPHGFGSTNSISVFSIEQDVQVKETTERRLESCGLKNHVEILYVPISEQGSYQLDAKMLRECLGSEELDWLVVDGPAGPKGCRASTLPSLARFCRPGARWFLDDAFRDGELEILNQWDRLRGIVVDGIYPIGKGLGTGIVSNPQQVTE